MTALYWILLSSVAITHTRNIGCSDRMASYSASGDISSSHSLAESSGYHPYAALRRDSTTAATLSGLDSELTPDTPSKTALERRKRVSRTERNTKPTPEPTGVASRSTTVHIKDERDFALLLPDRSHELISDAESDGVAFCTPGSTEGTCERRFAEGFIRAAAISRSEDGSYIQVTGCLDRGKSSLDPSDSGGQFDVRFPNGAQCTFGGYGASFIQLVEPASDRFCLRCCIGHDDQENCNSHQDKAGCPVVVPGTYSFPSLGVHCDE
ncbi:hypothetical protein C8Q80DRAFT_1136930 [Daedaleopsis nitida]|nr:hypothetical protein C8Q80DRAFT_1136930 [Daedaleopsis nitida]